MALHAELGDASVNQGSSILAQSRRLGSTEAAYGRDPAALVTGLTADGSDVATLSSSNQTSTPVRTVSFLNTGDTFWPSTLLGAMKSPLVLFMSIACPFGLMTK